MNREQTVAIYCRLSEEDRDKASKEQDSQSIQNQKSMLINYAVAQNWQIYNLYCDDGLSGAYAGEANLRPAFLRMIEDAKEKKFGIILCKTQSRFTRNIEELERYVHGYFVDWGIRFVSIVDNADTADSSNKKLRQVNGLVNEWFLEETSKNIRCVFQNKMKKGEYLASFAPYGYKKSERVENHLEPNPETAPIVKQIFAWKLEGYGAARICRMLNDMGIPNPRKQQELDGLRKALRYADYETGCWSASTIQDILHNRAYCGDVVAHKTTKASYKSKKILKVAPSNWIIAQNRHEPIIDRETFESVQISLNKGQRSTGTGKPHLLSGKVFCHNCGKPMQKNHSATAKNPSLDYLRCRDRYAYSSGQRCSTPNIRLDRILEAIHYPCIQHCTAYELAALPPETAASLLNSTKSDAAVWNGQAAKLAQELQRLDLVCKNLYLDKVGGVITTEQFAAYNREFTEKRDELQKKAEALTQKIRKAEDCQLQTTPSMQALQAWLQKKNIDRAILDALISKIVFGEQRNGTPTLKIYWAWENCT